MFGIVYVALCRVNGKQYVGQTFRHTALSPDRLLTIRRSKHERTAMGGGKLPFHSALRCHGVQSFAWSIVHEASAVEELNMLECDEIAARDCTVDGHGYNANCGGRNASPSDETRARMSAAAKRRWSSATAPQQKQAQANKTREAWASMPEEAKRRQSAIAAEAFGRPDVRRKARHALNIVQRTDSYRRSRSKLSTNAWTAKSDDAKKRFLAAFHSPASRAKAAAAISRADKTLLRESIRRRLARPFVVLAADGSIVATFDHVIDAATQFGVVAPSISACLHGRAKTFRGMRAEFLSGGATSEKVKR